MIRSCKQPVSLHGSRSSAASGNRRPHGRIAGACLVFGPSVQFSKNFFVAGRGKDHGALLCGDRRRMILEGCQFICQRNAADIGTDPVDRAHEVAGMEQRRHTGAAPWIGAAIAGNHGEEHRLFA